MTSTLYRLLEAAPKPLVKITTQAGTYTDHDISEVTAHHGGQQIVGYEPATCHYTFRGLGQVGHETETSWQLTPQFAEWIRDRTGRVPNTTRFIGRVGNGDVDDRGDGQPFTTTVDASSWATLLRAARRTTNAPVGNSLAAVLVTAFRHPALGARIPVTTGAVESFDAVRLGTADARFDEIMGDWAESRGIVCRQGMDGTVEIRPLSYHAAQLAPMAANTPALMRAQTLAPTKWSQPIDARGGDLFLKRRNEADTADYLQPWPELPKAVNLALETHVEDWTNTTIRTDNIDHAMNALAFRMNYARVGVTEVKVDISRLLCSAREYDWLVAGNLLALDTCQPIFLGGDWHRAIRGPMVITEIQEEISPSGWTMTLSLDTPRRQYGVFDTALPSIPAHVWKQYDTEVWADETRAWKDA